MQEKKIYSEKLGKDISISQCVNEMRVVLSWKMWTVPWQGGHIMVGTMIMVGQVVGKNMSRRSEINF